MPRLVPALLLLLLATPALAGGNKETKALHKGLHAAVDNPDLPPPSMLFDEEETAFLNTGEVLFDFQHIRGHELAVSAVTTPASAAAVWEQILDVESYPEAVDVVLWARIDSREMDGDREIIEGSMEVKLPALPGQMSIRAYYEPDMGYMPFHLIEGKKNPFRHVVGYWSVTPFPGDRSLVLLLVDAALDLPAPLAMKASLTEQGTAWLLAELAHRAAVAERDKALLPHEPAPEVEEAPAPEPEVNPG